MKALRIIVWLLVAVLFGATGWVVFGGRLPFVENASVVSSDIGGPFSLVDMNGRPVTDKTFAGRPHVIFFGYTHCPDVCPTTLGEYAALKEQLGQDAGKVDLLFVTVDPERDTPDVLKDYLSSFGDIVLGLSGSREQVDAAIKTFRVYARKVPAHRRRLWHGSHGFELHVRCRWPLPRHHRLYGRTGRRPQEAEDPDFRELS